MAPRANEAPLDIIRSLKLLGAPDQEPVEQGAGRCSRARAFRASRAGGLLNKEPTGPLWRAWVMGPLEQAEAPDKESGAPWNNQGLQIKRQWAPRARGSKSGVNGAPSDTIAPGARWRPIPRANWPLEQERFLNQ